MSRDEAGTQPGGSGLDPAVRARLEGLRDSIDNIDAALVHLLAERFKHTQEVGHLKAEHALPPADPERERRQIARLRDLAVTAKLDPEFAEKFLGFIIEEVIRHHQKIARS
ncbi:chorismate mutase [Allostreptomyces psammosilenae]|uniref:Chorismate mutase n=1 Tax=Allostreptomyces psammosilenae TaxID=1892865 RepID=A0A852ZLQ7_9ACTN|nr:chorismate mutase [Allostreptomyces psammosilenae]NYI03329.1 chorismate mutase [Allostreptomyces psammosilenae]